MPLIKAKSKIDAKCSYQKNGMTCSNAYKTGDDYIYDTDLKKGYCCSHEEINSKVTENKPQGGGSWQGGKGGIPLCRSPEEGLTAIKIWTESIVPLISTTSEKLYGNNTAEHIDKVAKMFEEIYLGKFTPSSVTNNS